MKRLVAAGLVVIAAACSSLPVAPDLPGARFEIPRQIKVRFAERGVIVTRQVTLEDYVRATTLSEFAPATGDPATVEQMLEVQAIISRTYAVSHLGRHASEGFDLCATTHCQLFEPDRLRTSRWAEAALDASERT